MCSPTSTVPAHPTAQPRPSTAGSSTSGDQRSDSAISPTTSPDPYSRPAASDRGYTLDREEPHYDGDDDHGDTEHPAHPGHFSLQRSRVLAGGVQQTCDLSHLGRHSGGDDHRLADTLGDRNALEDHVEPVAKRRWLGQGAGVLENWFALTGQGGLRHHQ